MTMLHILKYLEKRDKMPEGMGKFTSEMEARKNQTEMMFMKNIISEMDTVEERINKDKVIL